VKTPVDENPYSSPVDLAVAKNVQPPKPALFGIWESCCLLNLMVLAISAFAHRMMLGFSTDHYVTSPLIAFEFITLLIAILTVPLLCLVPVYFVVVKNNRRALFGVFLFVVTCATIVGSMWLDAPMLIYMT